MARATATVAGPTGRNTMADKTDDVDTELVHVITKGTAMMEYERLLAAIPDAPDPDSDDMLTQLLNATTVEELAAGSGMLSSKDAVGRTFRVEAIGKRPSDQESKTGYYLIIDALDAITRKPVTLSTSSDKLIIMLCKLHTLGLFPATIKITGGVSRSKREYLDAELIAAGGKVLKVIEA